jgi:nitrate reductase alpha subunit
VITSPEWSGSETGGRRYAPFTVNIEELKPFHTLTGRMHFYVDHDWLEELGEQLPTYRPPLDMSRLFGEPTLGSGEIGLTVRYLTPHSMVDPPSIRTTCSCCRCRAVVRPCG